MSTEQTYNFDTAKATSKIQETTKNLKTFAGKKNVNPFLDIANKVEPLNKRLTSGEKTKELFDAIMALKQEPEPIQACLDNEALMSEQKKLPPAAAMGLKKPGGNVAG